MTSKEAREILMYGEWFDELPEKYHEPKSKEGDNLVTALWVASEALAFEPKVVGDGPRKMLSITVPKGLNVGRVLVSEEGTSNGGLYYPD